MQMKQQMMFIQLLRRRHPRFLPRSFPLACRFDRRPARAAPRERKCPFPPPQGRPRRVPEGGPLASTASRRRPRFHEGRGPGARTFAPARAIPPAIAHRNRLAIGARLPVRRGTCRRPPAAPVRGGRSWRPPQTAPSCKIPGCIYSAKLGDPRRTLTEARDGTRQRGPSEEKVPDFDGALRVGRVHGGVGPRGTASSKPALIRGGAGTIAFASFEARKDMFPLNVGPVTSR